jgi:6-pyruvoyltetrahydropterin/6-carboxytetrahydropterin synthase
VSKARGLERLYRTFIETHFSAAHELHGYSGHCGRLHGHTWKVRVEVETNHIDEIGISIDFKELKKITDQVLEPFDHHHINEINPFDRENPTAENLSRYLYHEIQKRLPSDIRIIQVTVWESENYAVGYRDT